MYRCLFTAVLFASTLTFTAVAQDGPKHAVVLIIRHAEDGGTGHDLAPRGQERAEAYKDYFLKFTVDSKRLEPQVIFAAGEADSHLLASPVRPGPSPCSRSKSRKLSTTRQMARFGLRLGHPAQL